MNNNVNFEIAKPLKEKGFDTPTNRYYEHALTSKKDPETNDYKGAFGWKKGETNLRTGYFKNNYGMADLSTENWYMCSAPTIAEVVMWLYEKHGIWVSVDIGMTGFYGHYKVNPINTLPSNLKQGWANDQDNPAKSITEAYEAVIKYALENLLK